MLKTVADCNNTALYLMIYGDEGTGKTRQIATLSERPKGEDVGIVTGDESGPTSLGDHGLTGVKVWVLPGPDYDPFESAVRGVKTLRQDSSVKVIGIDACTVISANAIQCLSHGQGAKTLGFDGWGKVLAGFLRIEAEAQRAVRAGKHVIYTAWAQSPKTYKDVNGDEQVEAPGRPWIHGQGRTWLPGKTDGVFRLTSHFKRDEWRGQFQVHATEAWLAKTRWKLPDPAPANLKEILKLVKARRALQAKAK